MSHLLSALFLLMVTIACGGPQAEPVVHPCTLATKCVYDDVSNESNCESGYTWADPSDINNFNCVAIDNDSCVPTSCVAMNADCGTLPDGCEVFGCWLSVSSTIFLFSPKRVIDTPGKETTTSLV